MRKVYKCEKCEVEFRNELECLEHEFICTDYQKTVQENVLNAIKVLKEKYNFRINIQDINCYIEKQFSYIVNDINIEFTLPNDNRFTSDKEMFYSCNLMNYDEVYKLIESFIIPLLETKYEGIICNNPDMANYYDPYYLGDTSLREIASRFFGKRVKIEIINDNESCDYPSCTCDYGNI
jgi:hypothetical protein